MSLDEVDSVYLAANPFWSKPALAIAEMQPILAHLNEAATRTPLHPEQTQYSSQELRKITSDTIAKIWANKMIAEGLILPDIDIPTFRNQLEQSLTAPPAMADMDKQQAAASGMATHIQTRNTQESAQTWLRGKRFVKELNTVNHFDRRFMMPIRNNYLEIPCRILDEGMQDRKAAYVAPSSRFYQIKYTIRDIDGRILEDSASRIQDIRHEGYGIMSTLCAALYSENTRIGFKGVFYISPSAGFGEERTLSNDGIPIPGNSTLIVELGISRYQNRRLTLLPSTRMRTYPIIMAALFLSSLSQAIDDIQTSPSTITAFASPAAFTTDEAKMRHDVARHLGMLFGTALKNEGFRSEDFNLDTLCRELAIRLALQGHKIPEPAFKKEIETLAQRTACDIITRRQQTVAETNKTRSRRFMAENAEKPGIITTDSGLQYRIDKQGNGPTYNRYTDKPTRATVKLTVETLDGKLLDNTDDQTNSLTPGYTGIPGLEEALNFMPAGSRWTLYIPEDLAHEKDTPNAWFGTGGNPRTYASRMRQPCIPPHSALIITIELLEFKTVEPFSDIYFQPLIAPPPVCELPSIACADIRSRLQLSLMTTSTNSCRRPGLYSNTFNKNSSHASWEKKWRNTSLHPPSCFRMWKWMHSVRACNPPSGTLSTWTPYTGVPVHAIHACQNRKSPTAGSSASMASRAGIHRASPHDKQRYSIRIQRTRIARFCLPHHQRRIAGMAKTGKRHSRRRTVILLHAQIQDQRH